MNTEKFFDELTHRVAHLGLKTDKLFDEYLHVLLDGNELCRISNEGTILFHGKEINTLEKDELLNEVTAISLTTKEYMLIMDDAPPLKAQGLKDGYKKLAEYNGVVLAGIKMPGRECQFVTWRYTYDKKGVTLGHYYPGKYTEAKEDFAVRSGLLSENKHFNKEKLKTIHKAVDFCINENYNHFYKQKNEMKAIKNQIEYALPDVCAETEIEQSSEQQMNM